MINQILIVLLIAAGILIVKYIKDNGPKNAVYNFHVMLAREELFKAVIKNVDNDDLKKLIVFENKKFVEDFENYVTVKGKSFFRNFFPSFLIVPLSVSIASDMQKKFLLQNSYLMTIELSRSEVREKIDSIISEGNKKVLGLG